MYLFNQRGNVLLLTMVVLAFVSITTAAGLYISNNAKTDSLISSNRIQAYYIADAGVELALAKLQLDEEWGQWLPGSSKLLSLEKKEFAGGVIESILVRTLAKTENEMESRLKVELTVKGVYRQAQKTLKVTAEFTRVDGTMTEVKISSWKELYPVFV